MIKNIIFLVILVACIYATWKIAAKYHETKDVIDSFSF